MSFKDLTTRSSQQNKVLKIFLKEVLVGDIYKKHFFMQTVPHPHLSKNVITCPNIPFTNTIGSDHAIFAQEIKIIAYSSFVAHTYTRIIYELKAETKMNFTGGTNVEFTCYFVDHTTQNSLRKFINTTEANSYVVKM